MSTGNYRTTMVLRHRSVTFELDESFLDLFEESLPAVEKLVCNPAFAMKSKKEIQRIENAKGIDAETILHLSSHSHYMRYDKNVGPMPEKLLSKTQTEEVQTYENRFLLTLIRKGSVALSALHHRLLDVAKEGEQYEFLYSEAGVHNDNPLEPKLEITLKNAAETDLIQKYESRIKTLRTKWQSLLESPLMKYLKGSKEVLAPIMRTNLMLNDSSFQTAIKLWNGLFIETGSIVRTYKKESSYDLSKSASEALSEYAKTLILNARYEAKRSKERT